MAADGKTPPTHPQGGGGNIMCTCSIFVCRHKNNDMSTLLGHAHTYIPTDRQTDTQAYIHKSIQTYSYTYTWLHMCDVSPLWGGGWGGTRGGWIIYTQWTHPKKLDYSYGNERLIGGLVMIHSTSQKKTPETFNQLFYISYTNTISCVYRLPHRLARFLVWMFTCFLPTTIPNTSIKVFFSSSKKNCPKSTLVSCCTGPFSGGTFVDFRRRRCINPTSRQVGAKTHSKHPVKAMGPWVIFIPFMTGSGAHSLVGFVDC